ncbi:hypothetical protein [Streptosporangium sp. NPDC020145]|uniref:hypothetical protein n=1 Tax=Streptosporangium sp. NPDC020145 TaxID=3154694 RepID=UPI003442EECA
MAFNEYARLLAEARTALDEGRANDFRIAGRPVGMAQWVGIDLEEARRWFLVEAFRQYIREIRD